MMIIKRAESEALLPDFRAFHAEIDKEVIGVIGKHLIDFSKHSDAEGFEVAHFSIEPGEEFAIGNF